MTYYTDDVLQNCAPETETILLTDVSSINSKKKKKEKSTHRWEKIVSSHISRLYNELC